ncbi:hypothetical protein QTH91_19220 [Variovorax dokdonensis]|uniref:Uncharacterized protein n=1 Tax=Variovorax dokdonensis TaxID=344883 RepID=A0ABT7NFB1_9BURK|nr:hypothetical protein [Variovorax dokdonensis]MDM0046629.1 hypothetical protein [Variovorax dokdonensis]
MKNRPTPERIQESLCIEQFDAAFVRQLAALFDDAEHLSEMAIEREQWVAVYSENAGQLDGEIDGILEWLRDNQITRIYATSKHEMDMSIDGKLLIVRLQEPNRLDFVDLQLGLWMFAAGTSSPQLEWDTWRNGLYFSNPIKFAILRTADGLGSTTIAGPPELIAAVKANAHHGLYEWIDGVLPPDISAC